MMLSSPKKMSNSMTAASMASQGTEPFGRNRLWVAVVLAGTIALGLLSRRYPLPGILAEYTGDALYASAAFVGLALLFAGARSRSLAIGAFVLSAFVEFSQLLSWPWIQDLRSNAFGRMVLGSGFKWPDMVAYSLGAMAAAAVDLALRKRRVRMT
jgi:hypothetical protein